MDEEIPEEFKCPICFEIPQKEIYQCESGHTICDKCSNTLRECPQCRAQYMGRRIRNRVLESLLDKTKFNCIYKSKGCNEKIKRQEIREHEEICSYRTKGEKFCKQLGFPCEFVFDSNEISEGLTHFQTRHDFIISHDLNANICISGLKDLSLTQQSFWNPIVFDLSETNGFVWALLHVFNKANKTISPLCIQICEGCKDLMSGRGEPTVKFIIEETENTKMPRIAWSTALVDMKDAHCFIEHPPFGLHLNTLSMYYNKEFKLDIYCSLDILTPTNANRENTAVIYTLKNVSTQQPNESVNELSASNSQIIPSLSLPEFVEVDLDSLQNPNILESLHSSTQTENRRTVLELEPVKFVGTYCDVCKKIPVGKRYKCLQCADYDLCELCMKKNEHKEHVFAIVSNKTQESSMKIILGHPRKQRPFLNTNELTTSQMATTTSFLKCGFCPRASKFICLLCKPLFGYCVICFNDLSPSHLYDHCFAVVNTEEKSKIIIRKLTSNN